MNEKKWEFKTKDWIDLNNKVENKNSFRNIKIIKKIESPEENWRITMDASDWKEFFKNNKNKEDYKIKFKIEAKDWGPLLKLIKKEKKKNDRRIK